MKWKIEPPRDLRLVEISPEEKERILKLGEDMIASRSDARSVVEKLRRDVLERGHLENRRLDGSETLAPFSRWCHVGGGRKGARPYAEEISRIMFTDLVIPRLVGTKNEPVQNPEHILDEFLQQLQQPSSGGLSGKVREILRPVARILRRKDARRDSSDR